MVAEVLHAAVRGSEQDNRLSLLGDDGFSEIGFPQIGGNASERQARSAVRTV